VKNEDFAAVERVLQSGMLAQGPVAPEFEARWCELTGMTAAVATASGLGALRLSLLALGIGEGDEVIVPAYSCVALLNAPLALGAVPVLADVEHERLTLSPEDAHRRVTTRTRAIVAVDLFGMPAPLAELSLLELPVIEDCAHGIGGQTDRGPFGGGTEVSMSSFYATKMIGAGEGGILATRDPEVARRARAARDYGDQIPDWRHLNDKMSELEAALANEQLKRLDEILRLREERALRYSAALEGLREQELLDLPPSAAGRIWYRYVVRLRRHDAKDIVARARRLGVRFEQPVWDLRASSFWDERLRASADAFDRLVSLPIYPDLDTREQERVIDVLTRVLREP
jgi:dTDP-4-amino-4,6-dideoxygalactose transaminase